MKKILLIFSCIYLLNLTNIIPAQREILRTYQNNSKEPMRLEIFIEREYPILIELKAGSTINKPVSMQNLGKIESANLYKLDTKGEKDIFSHWYMSNKSIEEFNKSNSNRKITEIRIIPSEQNYSLEFIGEGGTKYSYELTKETEEERQEKIKEFDRSWHVRYVGRQGLFD